MARRQRNVFRATGYRHGTSFVCHYEVHLLPEERNTSSIVPSKDPRTYLAQISRPRLKNFKPTGKDSW